MSKRYVEVEEDDVIVNERASKYSPCGPGKHHNNCKHAVKNLIETAADVEEQVAEILERLVCALKDATDTAEIIGLNKSFQDLLAQVCCVEQAIANKIHEACDCPQCD